MTKKKKGGGEKERENCVRRKLGSDSLGELIRQMRKRGKEAAGALYRGINTDKKKRGKTQ